MPCFALMGRLLGLEAVYEGELPSDLIESFRFGLISIVIGVHESLWGRYLGADDDFRMVAVANAK